MSPALLAASAIAIAGAVACVGGRRGAVIALGTGLMLLGAAAIADPLPPLLTLVVRAVGAALAAELLWVGLRARPATAGASALPWPALALLAGAAFVVGIGVTGELSGAGGEAVARDGAGPAAALGTALAFAVIAIAGAARRSDGVQRILLALPLTAAAGLIETAFLGTPSALELTVLAGLGVAIAACVVVLATPADPAADRPTSSDDVAARR